MEGRWTIQWYQGYEGQISVTAEGERPKWAEGPSPETWGTASVNVPVVPCDDAAIERVAAKLAQIQGYHAGPLAIDRRSAVELLRAAGETP